MKNSSPRILVITPVRHINGVVHALEKIGNVTYMDDPSLEEVLEIIQDFDAIFTNPNKSKVFIGKELIDAAKKLKVVCTASTGTNHIDKVYASKKDVNIVSLTEERHIISRISSTAELAFSLTMAGIRNLVPSYLSVMKGDWDYTRFIGRQMNCLTVGIIGYGRLGSLYAKYCKAFDARVLVYDPYKKVDDHYYEQIDDLYSLAKYSDIISLHVHVTHETTAMVRKRLLKEMKSDVLIINTSRGEVIVEEDMVDFLKENSNAKIATDVLANEIRNRNESPLLNYSKISEQVLITSHIGGMTREAQEIAYNHAVLKLKETL